MKKRIAKKQIVTVLLLAFFTEELCSTVLPTVITKPSPPISGNWNGKNPSIQTNDYLNIEDDQINNPYLGELTGNYEADIGNYLYGLQYNSNGKASATTEGIYISTGAGINIGPRIYGSNWKTTYIPYTPIVSGSELSSVFANEYTTGNAAESVTLTVVNALLNAGNVYTPGSDAANPGYTEPSIKDGNQSVFKGLSYVGSSSVESEKLNSVNPHSLQIINNINQDALIAQSDTVFLGNTSMTIGVNKTIDLIGGNGGHGGVAGINTKGGGGATFGLQVGGLSKIPSNGGNGGHGGGGGGLDGVNNYAGNGGFGGGGGGDTSNAIVNDCSGGLGGGGASTGGNNITGTGNGGTGSGGFLIPSNVDGIGNILNNSTDIKGGDFGQNGLSLELSGTGGGFGANGGIPDDGTGGGGGGFGGIGALDGGDGGSYTPYVLPGKTPSVAFGLSGGNGGSGSGNGGNGGGTLAVGLVSGSSLLGTSATKTGSFLLPGVWK
ncbi:MAG: hypothetical protein KBD31_00005 [Proteobacteria bacterium]|nr:hypothetical protein [Pseudomonadota bacterium]